jgi:MFS family permease
LIGNAGVSRTSVGELAANNNIHQGRAFSIFGLCTALGTLLGPLLGGFLCQPAEKYGLKGPADLFVRYPYLLPCALGSCYNVVVVALCIPCLQETKLDIAKPSSEDEEAPLIIPQEEMSTLLSTPKRNRNLVMLIAGHAFVDPLRLLRIFLLTLW